MSPRVLIVIHGDEPAGWANQACHAVSILRHPIVRVLAIAGLSFPPRTAFGPLARRMYQQAMAYWNQEQECRIQHLIDEIVPRLPDDVEVVRLRYPARRLGDAVMDQMISWQADAILMAMRPRRISYRPLFDAVSHRLTSPETCAVILTHSSACESGK